MSYASMKVGDVIRFRYDGGSHPREVRHVIIESMKDLSVRPAYGQDDVRIGGWCLERSGYRNFYTDKMVDIEVNPGDVRVIQIKQIPMNCVRYMQKTFEEEGGRVYIHEQVIYVIPHKMECWVVTRPAPDPPLVYFCKDAATQWKQNVGFTIHHLVEVDDK